MTVAVTFMSKFVKTNSKGFKNFIEYIDREEAKQSNAFINESEFSDYVDGYMANPLKTYGLFTADKDELNQKDKEFIKDKFQEAQKKNSLMWQQVFSFDNEWLAENGLFDKENNILKEDLLRRYSRKSINEILKKENLENAIWTACIHKNTDNFHIHIAITDPSPTWKVGKGRCKELKTGEVVQNGMISKKTMNHAKRTFLESMISESKENVLITEIVRDRIIKVAKNNIFSNPSKKEKNIFTSLIKKLPDDKRLWFYGKLKKDKELKKYIDTQVDEIIDTYFKDEFKELNELLDYQQEKYKIYNERNNFKSNKLNDLHYRLGNALLEETRRYDRLLKEEETKKQKEHYEIKKNTYLLNRSMQNLKYRMNMLFKKDIQSLKNQMEYEKLMNSQNYM